MQAAQHTFTGFGVVILHKVDGVTNRCLKQFLVEAFKEKTTLITEYFGFDDLNVGDLSIDNIHELVLSVESSEMSIQLLILRMSAATGSYLGY